MDKAINDPSYRAVLRWLKCARESQGLKMRDVALLIEEPHSFVQKVESGERRLDLYEYVTYCFALNLDPRCGLDLLADDLGSAGSKT